MRSRDGTAIIITIQTVSLEVMLYQATSQLLSFSQLGHNTGYLMTAERRM